MMSAFSDKKFNASDYSKFRPTYPSSLFKAILEYHDGKKSALPGERGVVLDVGCGPGEACLPLINDFDKIIATDISEVMVNKLRDHVVEDGLEKLDKVEAYVSTAEDLSAVIPEDGKVDLVVAAECAHWLQEEKFLDEISRVLKDNGTLAYWGYVDPVFVDHPRANEIFEEIVYEKGDLLGPYWQQPGRGKLRNLFPQMNEAVSKDARFKNVESYKYNPADPKFLTPTPFVIQKEYSISEYFSYGKTWSSVHNWTTKNPGKEPHILDYFYQRLHRELGFTMDTKVQMAYKTVFTLAKRVAR